MSEVKSIACKSELEDGGIKSNNANLVSKTVALQISIQDLQKSFKDVIV